MRIDRNLVGVLLGVVVSWALLASASLADESVLSPTGPSDDRRVHFLPGERVYPEGVALDAATSSYFTGSLADGTVYRGRLDESSASVFSPPGLDGRTTAVGMKVDPDRRLLWVAGGATGRVWALDADTGDTRFALRLPTEGPALLNDVVIHAAGDVFVTDSTRPVLWRVPATDPHPSQLEAWLPFEGTSIPTTGGIGLNGIVATSDGRWLITVHSSARKLFRISVETRDVVEIDLGGRAQGGDGLALDDHTLYAVVAGQISRIRLNDDYSQGAVDGSWRDPLFAFPTSIAQIGARMLVVNAQLNTRAPGQSPVLPFTIADLPLPTDFAPPVAVVPGTGPAQRTGARLVPSGVAPGALILDRMDDGELVQRLRGGGYIFAFRHAATIADQKDTQPLNLRDCSAQRNLSDQGRADARAIGLAMTSASIRVGAVLASPFCRTRETAVIAFGRVELSPALFGETEERLSALRQLFSTVPEPGLNTVLVTHAASLAAIFGGVPTDVAEGDALIILPSDNGSFELLGRLTLGDWPRLLAVSQ